MIPPDVRRAGPPTGSADDQGPSTDRNLARTSYARSGPAAAMKNADDWWRECATRALKWMAELNQPFDAWDLVQLGVPEPDDPHRWGALFRAAAQQGLIETVGYAPSRRPSAAGSIARVWRGTSGGS